MAETKRILIVDDNEMSLKMAEFILKKTPHEIRKVQSGDECISMLQKEPVDLLLLDVEMPEKSGIETLREIRQMDAGKNLPVLFLTGTAEDSCREEAEALGAVGFAIKPLKPQELLTWVDKVL